MAAKKTTGAISQTKGRTRARTKSRITKGAKTAAWPLKAKASPAQADTRAYFPSIAAAVASKHGATQKVSD